jgi:5-formyltetrahydrofolate cyclo-ligase
MNKLNLRKEMKKMRDSMPEKLCIIKSNKIFNNFFHFIFPKIKNGKTIVIYNSFKKEVKTKKFIKFLLKKKYKIYNPCIINDKIVPCKLLSLKNLQNGRYGIPEPKNKIKLKSLSKIAAVIVPGIAFDKNGNRLGFGMGYFDKFLKKIKRDTLKIGLAFSFQVLKKIPATKNDIKMDYIITEKEIINVNKKK